MMYEDEHGNSVETPINKLPNQFWQNIGSDDEEENGDGNDTRNGRENVDDGNTEYGDDESRYRVFFEGLKMIFIKVNKMAWFLKFIECLKNKMYASM